MTTAPSDGHSPKGDLKNTETPVKPPFVRLYDYYSEIKWSNLMILMVSLAFLLLKNKSYVSNPPLPNTKEINAIGLKTV